jgi:peptidylprolyl isomerase
MAQVKKGDKVRINYTGKLEDGTIFDSTIESTDCDSDDCCSTDDSPDDCGCGCETDDSTDDCGCGCETGPTEITVGAVEFFPQIDEMLVGMTPGEKKTVIIPAEDAFGEYDEENVFTVPRADVPADMNPAVGDELVLTNDDEEELAVVVVAATEDSITFDANHPLAGEDLTFEVELIEIL